MSDTPEHMSQSDFAKLMGVSRAAVSQWKSKNILRVDAFSKDGKKGKVVVAVAVEQVRQNRDIGQALGNGIGTKTTVDVDSFVEPDGVETVAPIQLQQTVSASVEPDKPVIPEGLPKPVSIEEQIKHAKLEAQLRTNRMQASDEAVRQGELISTNDARAEMSRIASMMMQIFEGSLPDLAAQAAAKFDVPQRDVLHLLRSEFKKVRDTASKKEGLRAAEAEKEALVSLGLE